jgi:hypothetical protein
MVPADGCRFPLPAKETRMGKSIFPATSTIFSDRSFPDACYIRMVFPSGFAMLTHFRRFQEIISQLE